METVIPGDLVCIQPDPHPVRVAEVYWRNGYQIELTTTDGRTAHVPPEAIHLLLPLYEAAR